MSINTETYNLPSPKAAWERISRTQKWAANARIPLMVRLSRTSRLVTYHLEEAMKLNTSQMRVLFEANYYEGVSQLDLHKKYQIDPASITRTVQTMERDGLVTRSPDPTDNRLMRVFITEKGRALAETLPAQLAGFEQIIVNGLSEAEISQLHNLLERIEAQVATCSGEVARPLEAIGQK